MAKVTFNEMRLVKFEVMTCPTCGVQYALEERYVKDKRDQGESGKGWTCPNGCSLIFRKSTADHLRDQLRAKDAQLAREQSSHDQTRAERDHAEARRRAEKAAKTKIKNRVAHGVCPCCNRTFQNLQRHMASQHPDFAPPAAGGEEG